MENHVSTAVKQRALFNKLNLPREVKKIEAFKSQVEWSNLKDIKWIWDATLNMLNEQWITTQEELKNTTEEKIREIVANPLTLKNILIFIKK